MFAWWLPGDPPATAGPRSGVRAPGGAGRRGSCGRPAGFLLCRGPVPWSGSLRCSWLCCRPSSAWSCRLPPVRIAAGVVVPFGVVVAVAQVVPVVGKEQGGPGRFTWCQACCPPGGARQLLHLVPVLVPDRRRRCRCPPGAGRVIRGRVVPPGAGSPEALPVLPGGCRVIPGQLRGLSPAAGVVLVIRKKRSFFFLCLRFVRVQGWPPGQKKPCRNVRQGGGNAGLVVPVYDSTATTTPRM